MQTKITLAPIPDDFPTAYVAGGKTLDANGRVPSIHRTLTVGKAGGGTVWRASPGMVRALIKLQTAVKNASGAPLRLVDAYRDQRKQADARGRYERWLRAGKPDTSSRSFNKVTMKTAFVAKAGRSNHGWGGAIDIDQRALEFPGTGRGTNRALEELWRIAIPMGFTPILSVPLVEMPECWHLDFMGPLEKVAELFRANRAGEIYSKTAYVGCILANSLPSNTNRLSERYVQARLLIEGYYVGAAGCDGILGKETRKGLIEADIPLVPGSVSTSALIASLDAREIGFSALRAL